MPRAPAPPPSAGDAGPARGGARVHCEDRVGGADPGPQGGALHRRLMKFSPRTSPVSAAGLPAAGLPAAGLPAAGLPAAGLPAARPRRGPAAPQPGRVAAAPPRPGCAAAAAAAARGPRQRCFLFRLRPAVVSPPPAFPTPPVCIPARRAAAPLSSLPAPLSPLPVCSCAPAPYRLCRRPARSPRAPRPAPPGRARVRPSQ
jgi:hypothetical protein